MKLKALNLVELTAHESVAINAGDGESGWYWVTYIIGGFVRVSYEMGKSAKGNPHI